ncbi:MAG: HAD family phosphatase [Candidatus Eisenbacteria bacterium]|nr:HAD family phosphatase [Candidatus Eisenbacteria bacterium]
MARLYSLVIFDMDGVLADSSIGHALAYAELWSRLGIAAPPYATLAGRRTVEVVAEVTRALAPSTEKLDEWVRFKQDQARRHLAQVSSLYPDTLPVLDALDNAGLSFAVATGASRMTAELILAHAGGVSRFRSVVTGDDVTLGKPAPETYLKVLAATGQPADAALTVEDSEAGLRSGLDAGTWACSVRTGITARDDRFVGALGDLKGLLRLLGLAASCPG